MENYIDKFVEKTKETVDFLGEKTGEFIDYSKYKIRMSSLESELEKVYTKLGKVVYDSKKSKEDEAVLISLIVSEIDAIKKSISNLEKETAASKMPNKYTAGGYDKVQEDNHDVKIQPVETVDFMPEASSNEASVPKDGDNNLEDNLG